MLSFELDELVWNKGRTIPINGFLRGSDGGSKDLTNATVTMLVEQGGNVTEYSCSFQQDVAVASRSCPAPTETYPNNDVVFGDASFDFSAVLLPGAFAYFQKTGELETHIKRIHFVNEHYLTLFEELPAGIDATWNWWATDDNPTLAERGTFQFTPDMATLANGPFNMQIKLTESTLIEYSVHMAGRVITPIQP